MRHTIYTILIIISLSIFQSCHKCSGSLTRPPNGVGTLFSSAILSLSSNTKNYEVYYFEPVYDECKRLISSIIILGKIEENHIGEKYLSTKIIQGNVNDRYGIQKVELEKAKTSAGVSIDHWILNICIGTNSNNYVNVYPLSQLHTSHPDNQHTIEVQVSDNNKCPPVGTKICNGRYN